jgi:hypothetical protein
MRYHIVFLLISNLVFGKNPLTKPFAKPTHIAYSIGSTGYFGDIAPFRNYATTALKSARFSAGIEVSRSLKSNLTHRINLNYVMLNSSDKYYDSCASFSTNFYRGKSFTADLIDVSTSYEYGVNHLKLNPYFFSGIGLMLTQVRGGNMQTALNVPLGIGVKTAINKKIALALELNYRYTSTDLVDGLTDQETRDFSNTSIQLGPDLFYSLNFKLIYKLNTQTPNCPKIF